MNAIVITTTWNCVDLISTFLKHSLQVGFRHVLVMDFDSVDGTRDVLTSSEWDTFVTLAPFPGIAGLDSSNLLLAQAKASFGRDYWVLFCDPDELLVTPSMDTVDLDSIGRIEGADCLLLPRYNVTAVRSVARFEQERLTPFDALTLKIERRHHRTIDPCALAGPLNPPWIFTAIPGKAFVSLDTATRIGDGDHTAETAHPPVSAPPGCTCSTIRFGLSRALLRRSSLPRRT